MARPYRVLWLPAVAVLLPCVCIGLLGYKWLALEREAAAHRGLEAAQRAAAALRRDLIQHLQATAQTTAGTLAAALTRATFEAPPALPPLLTSAWLFDSSRTLLAPDDEGSYTRAIERGSQKASALLALARSTSSYADAERYATEIVTCCAGTRDEYGVSFPLYAAWRRAGLYMRRPHGEVKLQQLTRELHDLIARGYLGHPNDATELTLLAKKLGGHVEWSSLLQDLARVGADIDRRIETARLATRWLSDTGGPTVNETAPTFGVIRQASPAIVARAPVANDRIMVMFLDEGALGAWVERWASSHAGFDIALSRATDSRNKAVLDTPLAPEAPAFTLAVRQRAADPAADVRRQRLFGAALGAMIVLALVIGFMAMRDVSREMKTAALRSSFVAAVTHELRTPLASIRLLAVTLRHGRARTDKTPELLDTIVAETDRLSRLVDNVLSSSRIESGTQLYHPKLIVLADAVRSAIDRSRSMLERDGFNLIDHLDEGHVSVRADPDGLGQSVLNLVGNAAKYSGTSRQIRVTIARANGLAEIRIADDGIGITPAEQARIFDRFYRAPEAAAHTGGAGLGLTQVRHFADAHGGHVTVASEPGQGSVFSLWLPVAHG